MAISHGYVCPGGSIPVFYTDEDLTTQDNCYYGVDVSLGSRTIQLHDNPADNSLVKVFDVNAAFGGNPCVILPGAGDTIAWQASLALSDNNASVTLIYFASANRWAILDKSRG